MEQYVGLDVSQDVTHICVVDRDGKKLWEGSCESTPEAIGETIKKQAPDAVKIGLESGHLSTLGTGMAFGIWIFRPFALTPTMLMVCYASR